MRPVAAHGEDRLGGAGREGRDQQPLQDEVRVALRQRPVAEGGGIGAHQVGDHDLALAGGGRGRRATCRRSGSRRRRGRAGRRRRSRRSTPSGPSCVDRALQAGVAAVLAVARQAGRVDACRSRPAARCSPPRQDPDLRGEAVSAIGSSAAMRVGRGPRRSPTRCRALAAVERPVDQGVDAERRRERAGADVRRSSRG